MRFTINKSGSIAGLLLFMIVRMSSAQVSTAFYGGSNDTKVAIGYDFSSRVWTDLRMYGGVSFNYFTPELTINYNFVRKEVHDVYAGAGFSINGRNSLIYPVGLRLRPFEKMRSLSLLIEAEPLYNFDSEELEFVCFIGLRYHFKPPKP